MKTMKFILSIAITIVFVFGMLSAQNTAGEIITSTTITVKYGHHAQFIEGIKKWKECYLDNNGEQKWSMWHRVQGEGNVFVMNITHPNWAAFDEDDPTNKDCYSILVQFIHPHVEKVSRNISQNMPEFSRSWPEDAKHSWVTFYKVKNGTAFKEVVTGFNTAIKDKEGSSRGLWREYKGGGTDAPDYMVASPLKSFADLDVSRESVYQIYKEAVGAEKANEMREKWFSTVLDSWSYLFTLNTELSNLN